MRVRIALTALMLAGCGASEHSRFYVLTENPAAATRVTATSPATTVALGAVQLPAALDRPQMARRLNSDEISYSEYDRWAGPLDDMVRRVLIADLDGRLAPGMVLIENNPTSPASRTIAVDILRIRCGCSWAGYAKRALGDSRASGFSGRDLRVTR